jgi:hypothetical protein
MKWSITNIRIESRPDTPSIDAWVAFDVTSDVGQFSGEVRLAHPPPELLLPTPNVSEDQVIGWVKQVLGEEEVNQYEQWAMQESSGPVSVALPWNN